MTDVSTEPRSNDYEVVVVGGGLGGLSAAAFLAKGGRSVLLVERLDAPGGYAHSFSRGPYLYDPAVHVIGQLDDGQMVDTWLNALGVRDRVEFISVEHFYSVRFPDFTLNVPFGVDEFVEAHAEHFPHEAAGIRSFMDICTQIRDERDVYVSTASSGGELDAERFSTLLRYRSATVGDVLDATISDPRVRGALSAIWWYQGLPPDRLSFLVFAGMLVALCEDRHGHCRGSFQRLVDAYVAAIVENGGEVVVKQKVARILIESGAAAGIELEDGSQIHAPIVVSNADATQTFHGLVGPEHVPDRYLRRLESMRPAVSAFIVYAATTLDIAQFDLAHEVMYYKSWDHRESFEHALAGEPWCLAISVPTLVDPSLAPEGEHLVTAAALTAYDVGRPWSELKDELTQGIMREVESLFPGVQAELTFSEGASPLALHHYSLNRDGAMYGWENSPDQSFARRLSNKSPVPGLYLAGAWAQPGSGTVAVMQSGFQTAQMILGHDSKDAFLHTLGYAAAT